jgi:uncharacterized membrane protein
MDLLLEIYKAVVREFTLTRRSFAATAFPIGRELGVSTKLALLAPHRNPFEGSIMADHQFTSRNRPRKRIRSQSRYSKIGRWTSLLAGATLAAYGIKRRGFGGIATATAGGWLVSKGLRRTQPANDHYAQASFTIQRHQAELFQFWRDLENLPKFMYHLESVRSDGERRSHWVARGPAGLRVSWDAEITDERENDWIVWRSLPGSDIAASGSVYFRPAPGDRGTEVTLAVQYEPLAGRLGRAVATLLGRNPRWTVREELRRFKQLMETGEIPTTEGQSSGRRSTVVTLFHKAYRDVRPSAQPTGRTA